MDIREKLVELLHVSVCDYNCDECKYSVSDEVCIRHLEEMAADHLIANGVIVQDNCIEIDAVENHLQQLYDNLDDALRAYKESQTPTHDIYGKSMTDSQGCEYCDDPFPARDCVLAERMINTQITTITISIGV